MPFSTRTPFSVENSSADLLRFPPWAGDPGQSHRSTPFSPQKLQPFVGTGDGVSRAIGPIDRLVDFNFKFLRMQPSFSYSGKLRPHLVPEALTEAEACHDSRKKISFPLPKEFRNMRPNPGYQVPGVY